jgi:TrmH family RNA methyltransferase
MIEISSSSNALFRKYLSLTESKGLKKESLFLLSGRNLVQEFLQNPSLKIETELFTEGMQPLSQNSRHAKLSKALFEEIDILGTHSSILVLEQPELSTWDFSETPVGLHLLTPLGDPSNLGAVTRSAEAFGVKNLILLKEAANPFLPKAMKASAGSLTRLKLWKGPSIHELSGKSVIALDLNGKKLADFQWPQSGYLLVGEEGAGVPPLPGLQKISIPTQTVESLNATVATSIALYDYSQKVSRK